MAWIAWVLMTWTVSEPTAVSAETARFRVDLLGDSSVTFALPPGPRTVVDVQVLPAPGSEDAWKRARIRLAWDDARLERDPDVDLPVSDFVDASGKNIWPMSYSRRARLRIDTPDLPLRGEIRFRTKAGAADLNTRGYFQGRRRDPASVAVPPVILVGAAALVPTVGPVDAPFRYVPRPAAY